MKGRQTWRKMGPDGSYSGKYDAITGYEGNGKERFLHDAAALLREVAKHLLAHGLDQSEVHVSQSGVITSGAVTGIFWKSWKPEHRVWVQIEGGISIFGGRKDGVEFLARTQAMRLEVEGRAGGRRAPKEVWRYGEMGANQWLSAALDSAEIAEALVKIFDPSTAPKTNQFFTKSNGEMTIPDLVLRDNSLATQVAVERQWYHCAEADREDAALAEETPAPVSVQMNLFAEVPV